MLHSCRLSRALTRCCASQGGARGGEDGQALSCAAGVIPRAIDQIFTTLDGHDAEYTVKCSFLELYNEETTDLLAVGDAQNQKLRMLEDRSGVVVQVQCLHSNTRHGQHV